MHADVYSQYTTYFDPPRQPKFASAHVPNPWPREQSQGFAACHSGPIPPLPNCTNQTVTIGLDEIQVGKGPSLKTTRHSEERIVPTSVT